jgi:hypothetical protein
LKYLIFITALICINCNNSKTEKLNFSINPCSENIKHSLDEFDDNCKKLNFVKNNTNLFFCFGDFIYEMEQLTGHSPNYSYGTSGAYYRSDSILMNDIKAWEDSFNCK